ncbi:MAG: hypothetical protein IIB05_07945 [Bacteroidetes bacterium]|nr:hypothetical protein [Bacteroidota bacterium]
MRKLKPVWIFSSGRGKFMTFNQQGQKSSKMLQLLYPEKSLPGATFSLKKELGGKPMIFTVSTDKN